MNTPAQTLKQTLTGELGKTIYGMPEVIHGLYLALVGGGHVLLQGGPGLGKTLLAKTFAALLGGRFKRIQCTADMMPSDITGLHIFNSEKNSFEFVPGPLFADVVLVDEINRTGPKTQSALLEAMEERSVTIDRQTYRLPDQFLVIASQNPIEFEGTYPLPESQLDRFMVRLGLDFPEPAVEMQVLKRYDKPGGGHADPGEISALDPAVVNAARDHAAGVHVADTVYQYVSAIAETSRHHPQVSQGVSTRGALNLMRLARVEAAGEGAEFVTPDHVQAVAPAVLAHRLMITADASLEGVEAPEVVTSILKQVSVPRE